MFIDGLVRLYVEHPNLFWPLMFGVAPGFIASIPYGALDYSRYLCGKPSSGWRWFKFLAIADAATVVLLCYIWNWFPTDDPLLLTVGLVFTALLGMFPLLGGMMTGMEITRFYWFLKRLWHQYRNTCQQPT